MYSCEQKFVLIQCSGSFDEESGLTIRCSNILRINTCQVGKPVGNYCSQYVYQQYNLSHLSTPLIFNMINYVKWTPQGFFTCANQLFN